MSDFLDQYSLDSISQNNDENESQQLDEYFEEDVMRVEKWEEDNEGDEESENEEKEEETIIEGKAGNEHVNEFNEVVDKRATGDVEHINEEEENEEDDEEDAEEEEEEEVHEEAEAHEETEAHEEAEAGEEPDAEETEEADAEVKDEAEGGGEKEKEEEEKEKGENDEEAEEDELAKPVEAHDDVDAVAEEKDADVGEHVEVEKPDDATGDVPVADNDAEGEHKGETDVSKQADTGRVNYAYIKPKGETVLMNVYNPKNINLTDNGTNKDARKHILFPSLSPTDIPIPGKENENLTMLHMDPEKCGYKYSSGVNPAEGYLFVYPHVSNNNTPPKIRKKRVGCC